VLLLDYIISHKQETKLIYLHNPGEESSFSWQAVTNGIPYGSILGPLLFLMYIDDLPYGIYHTAKPVIYADDTSALVTARNINELQITAK
jgi:hypothetical protein